MITFKSTEDLGKLSPKDPAHNTVEKLVVLVINEYPKYVPEDDGYLVLIESDDVDRVLDDIDIPWQLSEVPFEGVTVIDGCFHAVYLANNQFALSILVPDADWLPEDVRRHLEAHI